MSPQRRTALVSVGAACLLVAIKLVAGLASSSLGLLAEAAHSGTDLAAALLTFFAVSVAVRPADAATRTGMRRRRTSPRSPSPASSSSSASSSLSSRSCGWPASSSSRSTRPGGRSRQSRSCSRSTRRARWSRCGRAPLSKRCAACERAPLRERFRRHARCSRGPDCRGARFPGRRLDRGALRLRPRRRCRRPTRWPQRRRAHGSLAERTTPDRASTIAALEPPVELRRLRLRRAGGEHFADVVIGVAPGAAIGQGHAAADRVEDALHGALPGIDVVVHVEPARGRRGTARARARRRAHRVARARDPQSQGSRRRREHRGLAPPEAPGDLPLDQAHEIAEQVEAAILAEVPEVKSRPDASRAASRDGAGRGDRHRHRRDRVRRP